MKPPYNDVPFMNKVTQRCGQTFQHSIAGAALTAFVEPAAVAPATAEATSCVEAADEILSSTLEPVLEESDAVDVKAVVAVEPANAGEPSDVELRPQD